jgi:aminopeptidase N
MKINFKGFFFIVIVISFFFQQQAFSSSALRSDTLDIRKTTIHFTALDFISKQTSAFCLLDVKVKMNGVTELVFDLEGLIVDSAKVNTISQTFTHTSPALKIQLSAPMQINDSAIVEIFYHGIPIADATWGGFYFMGNYGFQMGVGFNAQPHSFGRTWHPCFDNFVERSSYEFYITTTDSHKAICNGLFIDSIIHGNNTITWHWKLDENIPSYLSSVAISNYVMVNQTLTGNNGNTPAEIACQPTQTAQVNGSFAHLQESFTMLENRFGTYSWPKVGYTLVPFNAGAMEHATNIHIGNQFINGTLAYETLVAHELSHHWWGDLVTCSTAGDMWLNEGFASYSELLHQEYTYGSDAYQTALRDNHFSVISNAHIDDDGYRAVANIDSLYTYGPTVYLKGASVIHSLRSYLGDAAFFGGATAFLNANKFKEINSSQLRDYFTNYSGKDMTPFFNDWIFSPGFTNFCIDSTTVTPTGNGFDVSVFIRQRKHKSNDYYEQVPLEIGFYQNMQTKQMVTFNVSGRCTQLKTTLSFNPQMILIDPEYKLTDAITEDWKTVNSIGITNMNYAKCRLHVKSIPNAGDSALVRIEHHWVAADRFKNSANANGYVLHDSRYWHVDGIDLNKIEGWLQFPYNKGPVNHYLDSTWLKNTEDSLQLFWRSDTRSEWLALNDSIVAGNLNDGLGNVYYKQIVAGDYCLGIKRSNYIDPMNTDAPNGPCNLVNNLQSAYALIHDDVKILPNPNHGSFQIELPLEAKEWHFELFDLNGRSIKFNYQKRNLKLYSLAINDVVPGLYVLKISNTALNRFSTHKISITQ